MLLFHFTTLLMAYSYSALAKPVLDNFEFPFPSALTSTSGANTLPDNLLTDGATSTSNTDISWVDPSSSNPPLSEAESKPADTESFTISESPCSSSRARTNGKLRIRDQPALCNAKDAPMTQPFTQPLQQSRDYGSDYEQARPAVSPQDAALSQKDREKALMDQNQLLGDNDPLKCTRPPFFIPVCCFGDLELMDLMVGGQTVFAQVPNCVSYTSNLLMVPLLSCIAHGYLLSLCCQNFKIKDDGTGVGLSCVTQAVY